MSERNETTRVCKCCGFERRITDYDINNNGRPINLCKKCRRAQQTMSNLRNREILSTKQSDKLIAATQWLELCHQTTGYVSGTRVRQNTIDFEDPDEIAKMKQTIAERLSKANEEV